MQITTCIHFSLYLIWKMYAINLNNLIFLDVYFQDVSFCSITNFEQATSKKKSFPIYLIQQFLLMAEIYMSKQVIY